MLGRVPVGLRTPHDVGRLLPHLRQPSARAEARLPRRLGLSALLPRRRRPGRLVHGRHARGDAPGRVRLELVSLVVLHGLPHRPLRLRGVQGHRALHEGHHRARRVRDRRRPRARGLGLRGPRSGRGEPQLAQPGQTAPDGHGFFLGIVFAIFAITGWGRGRRRSARRARIPSATCRAASWDRSSCSAPFCLSPRGGRRAGGGTDNIAKLGSSEELPAFVLGHRFWGGAWDHRPARAAETRPSPWRSPARNAATRIFFSMGRSGVPAARAVDRPPDETARPSTRSGCRRRSARCSGWASRWPSGRRNVYKPHRHDVSPSR